MLVHQLIEHLAGLPPEHRAEGAAAFLEARAAALGGVRSGASGRVVTLADVGVHGLVAQWGDDGRLEAYVERCLGPLLDGAAGSDGLLAALVAFLEQGGNKSSAATALQLSRPAVYARLDHAGLSGPERRGHAPAQP